MTVFFAHLICITSTLASRASALESDISALEKAVTTLDNSFGWWEKALPWFTALVVLGLLFDLVVIICEHREAVSGWHRWVGFGLHFPDRPTRRMFILELVGTSAIFIGVALEVGAGVGIAYINGQLRAKNSELRNKSDQLVELLNDEAEKEKLARVQIEAKVAWRSLTSAQQAEIGSALAQSPRLAVQVGYEGADAESSAFASDIADALQASHVLKVVPMAGFLHTETPTTRKGQIIPSMETGVLIVPTKDKPSKSLARAISKELNDRGFDARVGNPEGRPSAQVRIDVGPRPIGPQGEYKLQTEWKPKTGQR